MVCRLARLCSVRLVLLAAFVISCGSVDPQNMRRRLRVSTVVPVGSTICVTPATGCASTQSTVQAALSAAANGDTIKLHAGTTYTEALVLPNKGVLTANIVITTDAAAGNLPAAGVRTCGGDKCGVDQTAFGEADLTGVPDYSPYMPKLASVGSGSAIVTAAAGANHYTFRHIDFPPIPFGFNTQMELGAADSTQQFESQEPTDITVDQCYFHGDPLAGQNRAIAVNGKRLTISNSFFTMITAVGQDSQCVAGWNGHGPLTVTNNFMECGTENFILGGSDPHVRTYMSITGGTSTTGADVATTEASHTLAELKIGQRIAICPSNSSGQCSAIRGTGVYFATIASMTGSGSTGSLTWTPAVPVTPDTTGLIRAGAVLEGLTFQRNFLTKDLRWRVGVLNPPTMVSAVAGSGGTLSGTYYYQAQSLNDNGYAQNRVRGQASSELSASPSNQKVTLTYTADSRTGFIRIFRGTTPGGENQYTDCSTAPCLAGTFVDDGSLSWGSASPGFYDTWVIKNLFELKAVITAQIDSNIMSAHWRGSDVGNAVWLNTVNQEGGCWFCETRDVVFEKTWIKHVGGAFSFNGQETEHGPRPVPMTNVTIKNVLVTDSTSAYGDGETPYAVVGSDGFVSLVFDHVTLVHTATGFMQISGLSMPTPIFRNSMFRGTNCADLQNCNFNGIHSPESEGAAALAAYMPGYTWTHNDLANVNTGSYPAGNGNVYDTLTAWQAHFVNYSVDGALADYAIQSGSALHQAGTDGKDYGADVGLIATATSGVVKGIWP